MSAPRRGIRDVTVPRGTADRERPLRISLAALEVVGERGVEGLTHRAVAAAAGVPLGSTTYHFKTLDDLLVAAIQEAKRATDDELIAWSNALHRDGDRDLPRALARYVLDALTNHWGRTVVEIELYMAALRRPQLLELSRGWDESLVSVLEQHAEPETAKILAMMVDGILVRAMIHGKPSIEEVESVFRRVMR
jgi:TetR/AcrR family transcriptional regulator, regulator of biofilm formation and stress response